MNRKMAKVLKILLCSEDDGIMVKTIKSVIREHGFEENIVLVKDQHDVDTISKEIVDADVVYPDKAVISEEMIRSAKKVRLFQYGTGYDTIDLAAAGDRKFLSAICQALRPSQLPSIQCILY